MWVIHVIFKVSPKAKFLRFYGISEAAMEKHPCLLMNISLSSAFFLCAKALNTPCHPVFPHCVLPDPFILVRKLTVPSFLRLIGNSWKFYLLIFVSLLPSTLQFQAHRTIWLHEIMEVESREGFWVEVTSKLRSRRWIEVSQAKEEYRHEWRYLDKGKSIKGKEQYMKRFKMIAYTFGYF